MTYEVAGKVANLELSATDEVDNIVKRIDLQTEAYGKEENLPKQLFEVYEEQKAALLALKKKYGAVVKVEQLIEAAAA